MTRTILHFKGTSPAANMAHPRQRQLTLSAEINPDPLLVEAGNLPKKGVKAKKPPPLLMQIIEDATKQRTPIFIQMRSGTGYKGLPIQVHDGCVKIVQATIHGTKRNTIVTDVLIHLGDCGQVAHIHLVSDGELQQSSISQVEASHAE